jgi:nitroreductase
VGRAGSVHTTDYHDATKHHFGRFARSPGRLDWATQPNPFRRFDGAPTEALPRATVAGGVAFDDLHRRVVPPAPVTPASLGECLRCSFGLSAWKAYGATRWALRVNPSSGNLHPTEAYLLWQGRVSHYAPEAHALEERARLDGAAWPVTGPLADGALVALTSIAWREAWKYGERAFRYCQHDIGHALGALRYGAALLGWHARVLESWSDADIAAAIGIDRDGDFADAEREWPACMVLVTPHLDPGEDAVPRRALVAAARRAVWAGHANVLSAGHVAWPAIDAVEAATRHDSPDASSGVAPPVSAPAPPASDPTSSTASAGAPGGGRRAAREVILARRSAVAFDPRPRLGRAAFARMLARLRGRGMPWDILGGDPTPHVHICLFVHRVEDVTPGIYALLREDAALPELRAALRPEFLWEPASGPDLPGLHLLLPADVTWPASRLSCDQAIAGDGFFSLGMIARFAPLLAERGEWFYRRLFWECGLVGQVLYLEAEAHGDRGTGIGCFYDDAVHDTLGLSGHDWQSLYHFAIGAPVDDPRLTTSPGYDWE